MRRNWGLGKLITEEELKGKDRAAYGASIIKGLSKRLTKTYGKGFTKSYLYSYVIFYKTHMTIFQSPIGKSRNLLSWTHYYILTQELNQEARAWYEKETVTQEWSTRTLQRNISSQYYYRILASQHKDLVEKDDTDEDIARYSVLHDNDHLFASKYMLYMPTPEQLRAEIERQKAIYYLKAKEAKEDE